METQIIAPSIDSNASIGDLRKMISAEKPTAEAKTEAPKTETPEDGEVAVGQPAKNTEAAPGTASQQEPEDNFELPAGAKKRIEQEVAKQTRIEAEINRAISARKAKEDELSKLTGKSGSEPAPNTAPATTDKQPDAKPARPAKPVMKDDETWAQFQAREASYETDLAGYEEKLTEWLAGETRRSVEREFSDREAKRSHEAKWDAAAKEHGAEFPTLMDGLLAKSSPDLQFAISQLENWSGVAVHLAKNDDALKAVADQFAANPYLGMAALGRLEASLKPDSKQAAQPAKTDEKPLPAPPAKVGGGASALANVDLEKASFRVLRREVGRMTGKSLTI